MKHLSLLFVLLTSLNVNGQSIVPFSPAEFNRVIWVKGDSLPRSMPSHQLLIVEFWATWCTPCLANLKHLNQLSDSLKDKGVTFVSITDEAPDKINHFLNTRVMNGWVGCDTSRYFFEKLSVNALPRTFVFNNAGKVLLDTRPEYINTVNLLDLLHSAQQVKPILPTPSCPGKGSWGPGTDPAFTAHYPMQQARFPYQRIIRKTIGGGGSGFTFKEHFSGVTLLNHSLSSVISYCSNFPGTNRIINQSNISDSIGWDVIFSDNKPIEQEAYAQHIKQAICQTFDLSIEDSLIKTDVYVVTFDNVLKTMREDSIDFNDPLTKTYISLDEIFRSLEQKGEYPVVYSPTAAYLYLDIFEIYDVFYQMKANELKDWLVSKGVQLKKERQLIKHLVIKHKTS